MQILSKLVGEVADKISSYMRERGAKCVVPGILEILRDEITTMEIQQIALSLNETVPARDNTMVQCSHTQPSDTQSVCMFCKSSTHHSNECRRYRDPKTYLNFMFKCGLCFNCLDNGHKAHCCSKPSQCNLCGDWRKHSQVLCLCY